MRARRWAPAPLPLAEAEAALGLARLAYGEADFATRPFFEWLYRENPAGEAVFWYAPTGDPAAPSAGHYVVAPVRVAVRGRVRTASLSVNTLTHPRHRREGVFATLAECVFAECARRGIAFTYGFPNPSSYPGFVGRLRFADIGRLRLLVTGLRPGGAAPAGAGTARRLVLRAGAGAAAALGWAARRLGPAPDVPVAEVEARWPGWDGLWRRLAGRYPVMVVRDAAWIAWRFGACPTRRYRLWVADGGGEAVAFAATRTAPVLGMEAGLVVDLLAGRGEAGRRAARAVLRRALAELAAAGMPIAAALAPPGSAEHAALRRTGFLPCPRLLEPQPFPVILRRHGAEAADVPAALGEGWFLTMGDYDAV